MPLERPSSPPLPNHMRQRITALPSHQSTTDFSTLSAKSGPWKCRDARSCPPRRFRRAAFPHPRFPRCLSSGSSPARISAATFLALPLVPSSHGSHNDPELTKPIDQNCPGRWHATARNRENGNGRSRGRPFRYKHSGGSRADEQARFKSLRSDRSWSPSRHESLAEAPQTGTHKRNRAQAPLGEGFP